MFFSRSSRKRGAAHPRFLVLRRRWLGLAAAGLAAAAVFAAVNYPAAVSASAAARQLPIYCVQRDQKVCAISFDAAWGDGRVRQLRSRGCGGRSGQCYTLPSRSFHTDSQLKQDIIQRRAVML